MSIVYGPVTFENIIYGPFQLLRNHPVSVALSNNSDTEEASITFVMMETGQSVTEGVGASGTTVRDLPSIFTFTVDAAGSSLTLEVVDLGDRIDPKYISVGASVITGTVDTDVGQGTAPVAQVTLATPAPEGYGGTPYDAREIRSLTGSDNPDITVNQTSKLGTNIHDSAGTDIDAVNGALPQVIKDASNAYYAKVGNAGMQYHVVTDSTGSNYALVDSSGNLYHVLTGQQRTNISSNVFAGASPAQSNTSVYGAYGPPDGTIWHITGFAMALQNVGGSGTSIEILSRYLGYTVGGITNGIGVAAISNSSTNTLSPSEIEYDIVGVAGNGILYPGGNTVFAAEEITSPFDISYPDGLFGIIVIGTVVSTPSFSCTMYVSGWAQNV